MEKKKQLSLNLPDLEKETNIKEDVQEEIRLTNNIKNMFVDPALLNTVTTISETVEIEGNIQAIGNIVVSGKIVGEITSKAKVTIYDTLLEGSIKARDVELKNAEVRGNIFADNSVVVGLHSTLIGNIKTKDASINALMKGRIVAEGLTHLGNEADVTGDIITNDLEMLRGCQYKGRIRRK